MGELSKLPNIGKGAEADLNKVGITTVSQLKEAGAKNAWLKLKTIDPGVCINRLYDLEGAVRGIKTRELDSETKADLKEFYDIHKMI